MKRHRLEIKHDCKSQKKRAQPSSSAQDSILDGQKYRCFYCGLKFHEWYLDYKKVARCRDIHWDHVLPFSYSFNNDDSNFVAACKECNLIKLDKVFHTLNDVANYVRSRRTARGLPVHGVWGNKTTQKAMAEVLFSDLSEQVFLEKPQNEDSVETLQRKLDNIKALRGLIRKL